LLGFGSRTSNFGKIWALHVVKRNKIRILASLWSNLYVGALATATNEVINSSKQVINVTIDCGTY
jgi:hypothetical protein